MPSFLFFILWRCKTVEQLNGNSFCHHTWFWLTIRTHIFLWSILLNSFSSFHLTRWYACIGRWQREIERQTTYLLSLPNKKGSNRSFMYMSIATMTKMCWANYKNKTCYQHIDRIIKFWNEFSLSKNAIDLKISANSNF